MFRKSLALATSTCTAALLCMAYPAFAQDATSNADESIDEIIVTADRVGLLESRPTESVFRLWAL